MDEAFLKAVGARIREIREAKGMTQVQFAAAAKFEPSFAGRVERGKQNLTLVALGRSALALEVEISRIFDGIQADAAILESKPRANARPKVPRPRTRRKAVAATSPDEAAPAVQPLPKVTARPRRAAGAATAANAAMTDPTSSSTPAGRRAGRAPPAEDGADAAPPRRARGVRRAPQERG